jgi:2-polyprenyl-3-methyl-5-hydroxy-6-metoxy-1,4-benzoquinol methylase
MKLDYSIHYEKWHSYSPEHVRSMKSYYRSFLVPKLPESKAASMIDIGCGMGFAMMTVKEMGYENIRGIEIDQSQAEKCSSMGLDVEQIDDSEAYLNRFPEEFEAILLLDVLEHIPCSQQLGFLGAVARALKPGGRLIVTVPNANSILASRWRYIDWTHHISFTECSLDFLLRNAGFKTTEIGEVEFIRRPRFWWLPTISRIRYINHRIARNVWRWHLTSELGWEQAKSIPLSLNLLATAVK